MIDVSAALRELFRSEPTITNLTDRVYVGELPRDQVSNTTGKLIIIAPSGGLDHNRLLPMIDPRFDIWCLADTYNEASRLDLAVFEVIRHLVRRTVNGVLIHSISWNGGPFMVRDDLTGWPSLWRSIVVYADARPTDGG